jgi:hypothetical protein
MRPTPPPYPALQLLSPPSPPPSHGHSFDYSGLKALCAMHCSVPPAGQLPGVRAVKQPPPGADKPLHTAGSAIYRSHQQTQRTSPEIQPGCPLSLAGLTPNQLSTSLCTSAIASSCHLEAGSTNGDETQGYRSGAAARNQGVPCTPIPPRVAAALLPQSGGHQEARVARLSSCYTCLCAGSQPRQIR